MWQRWCEIVRGSVALAAAAALAAAPAGAAAQGSQLQSPVGSVSINVTPVEILAGGTADVYGAVYNGSRDVVGSVTVDLSASDGFVPAQVTTGDQGTFQAVFSAPGTVAGGRSSESVKLTATIENPDWSGPLTASTSITVDEQDPVVAGVSPSTGPITGGNQVTITGAGFEVPELGPGGVVSTTTTVNVSRAEVMFGNQPASQVSIGSATNITATAPAGVGAVDVQVITPFGESPVVPADRYTYVEPPAPTVSGVSPSSGLADGGYTVTVSGSNFGALTAVDFGGQPSPHFTVDSSGQITATVPPGTGSVDVTVADAGQVSAIAKSDRFAYLGQQPPPGWTPADGPLVEAVTPDAGAPAGGTAVTVQGYGFNGVVALDFGQRTATGVLVVSPNEITASSPPGTGRVDVSVQTGTGSSPTGTDDLFFYSGTAPPAVTGVSPPTGPAAGGTTVTVSGTDLLDASGVSFGSAAATSFAVTSDGEVDAVSPPGKGTVDVTVTTPGGSSAAVSADRFTYAAPPGAAATPSAAGTAASSVGSSGGTLATGDGGFSLSVPQGAVAAGSTLSVAEGAMLATGLPTGYVPASAAFTVSGAALGSAAPARIRYDTATLGGASPQRLCVYTLAPGGTWSPLPTRVDAAAGTVGAQLPGPGTYEVVADTATFRDVAATFWAAPAIEAAAAAGVIQGFPDGTFQPQQPVTRAQWIAMLLRAAGGSGAAGSPRLGAGAVDLAGASASASSGTAPFSDVPPSAWYAADLAAAAQEGILKGAGGLAQPNQPVSRQEAAVLLMRTLAAAGPVPQPAGGGTAGEAPGSTGPSGPATGPAPPASVPPTALAAAGAGAAALAAGSGPPTSASASASGAPAAAAAAPPAFSDAAAIAPWAKADVATATADGFLHGFPNGSFRPGATLDRAQAAAVIAQVLQREA